MNVLNFEYIKNTAPAALNDFELFLKEHFSAFLQSKEINFFTIPFEFQIGVLKMYFSENGTDIDDLNLQGQDLVDFIYQCFISQNGMIAHFS